MEHPYTLTYLGHIIKKNSDLTDDVDMMRQTGALYARANTIIRQFLFASLKVIRNLCCLELSALRSMFYVPVLGISYVLLTMMLLDSCCRCSASRHFALIMFRHLLL